MPGSIIVGGHGSAITISLAIRGDTNTLKMDAWKEDGSSLDYFLLNILFLVPQSIQTDYLHFIEAENEIQRV